ncbi:MAG: TRAP transporter small permease [Hyphomicrobiales bacterium]|nr:TRAP transporter small permease [Hyphomicrobiales bacterium]
MSSSLDDLLQRVLGIAAAVLLFALMMLTCVDVVGRYFLNRPVLGAFELTEMALALLIFIGLPLVTLRQEHISVDLFDAITPRWLLRVQHVVAHAIGAVATGYLAWRLWLRATGMLASGETTAQLKMALGYLCAAMAVLTALTALAFFIVMLRAPREQSVGGDI